MKFHALTCLETLLVLVTDKHSSDLRASASLAVAKTFDSYLQAVKAGFLQTNALEQQKVLDACLTKLMECVVGDNNQTSRTCAADALRDTLQACYNSGDESPDGSKQAFVVIPTLESTSSLVNGILQQCGVSIRRRAELEQSVASNEGFDAEDRDRISDSIEVEEELLTTLGDALGHMLKLHGEHAMPLFDSAVAPAFSPYLSSTQQQQLQVIAICLLDDAIEFGGASAHKYVEPLLPTLTTNALQSDHAVLRQCSVYGIARAACVAPAVVARNLHLVLPCLLGVINSPNAADEENEGTLENAVFAIGAICANTAYRASLAQCCATISADCTIDNMAALWLQRLPLRADEQEAKAAHKQLCDMIETNDAAVFGANCANLKDILRVIAEVADNHSSTSNNNSLNQSLNKSGSAQDSAFFTPLSTPSKLNNSSYISGVSDTPASLNNSFTCRSDDKISLAHPSTIARMQGIVKQICSGNALGSQVETALGCLSEQHRRILQTMCL